MTLPLMDLFYQLREEGLPLSIEQYYRVARYLVERSIVETPRIKRVCQTVWVKSPYQRKLFDAAWQEMLAQVPPEIDRIAEKREFTREKEFVTPTPPIPSTQANEKIRLQLINEFVTSTPPTPSTPPIPPTPPTPQIATGVKQKAPSRPKPKDKSEYYPVQCDQLDESWQNLRPLPLASPYREIDIIATVIETAKQGFFDRPIYRSRQQHRRQVVLLIDRSESMIPLAGFGRRLGDAWNSAPRYYFENVIEAEIYLDDSGWQSLPLAEILRSDSREQSVCVIYSDAGAARGIYLRKRVKDTEKWLKHLTKRFNRVAWLNPLPSQRWFGNTAIDIADLAVDLPNLKMFALNSDEFSEMVTWLKGEAIPCRYLQPDSFASKEDDAYYSLSADSRIKVLGLDRGQETLDLATLGAFPLGLTPELLHYLRKNLKSAAPWYAVADILLSSLVHRVEEDLYEMDREVRQKLLERLKPEEIQEIAQHLQDYIQEGLNHGNGQQNYRQAQAWTALAYLQPSQAVNELKKALQEALTANNRVRLVKLASIVDILSPALGDYEPLITFTEAIAAYARGDHQTVSGLLDLGKVSKGTLQQVLLDKLEIIGSLKRFTSETVYVNKKGEIIKREPVTAHYYEEPLKKGIDPLTMIAIPAGEFQMGSPGEKGDYNDEKPPHPVKVNAFYLSQTPITQAQWEFIAKQPQIARELKPNPSYVKEKNNPVENVNWYDAIEFCARLSRHTGREYRLPSEAEWEYACRARTTTPFHFGETITGDLANYNANNTYAEESKGVYRSKTTPVKQFPPNAFGLHDMHGNVWEWCLDPWHDSYKDAPKDSRVWDEKNENDNRYHSILDNINVLLEDKRTRVLRGGSWYAYPVNCRSANRFRVVPVGGNDNIGFRVACAGA